MLRSIVAVALLATAAAPLPLPAVRQRIAVPDGGWDYVSFDSASHRVFIGRSDGVMTIDAVTGTVVPQLVAAMRTHAALALGTTGLGAVTSTAAGGVVLFDAATGAVRATVATGTRPDAAVYDAASGRLLVMDGTGTVTLVDPAAAKITGTVAIGGALEGAALDGRGTAYVAVEDHDEIAVVDLAAATVARRIALPGCDGPGGLALTPAGVLIAACGNRVAKAVDAATGAPLADLAIGSGPDSAFVDAARNRAYVPTGRDGMLTVIDTSQHRPRVIGAVPTQVGARTGAVDPATGTVYVIAAQYEPAVGGARPRAVPGSVVVLAVR